MLAIVLVGFVLGDWMPGESWLFLVWAPPAMLFVILIFRHEIEPGFVVNGLSLLSGRRIALTRRGREQINFFGLDHHAELTSRARRSFVGVIVLVLIVVLADVLA